MERCCEIRNSKNKLDLTALVPSVGQRLQEADCGRLKGELCEDGGVTLTINSIHVNGSLNPGSHHWWRGEKDVFFVEHH